MKTLIISDLHLGRTFQPERYDFLVSLLSSADRIILNGDFWDLYTDTFQQFVQSPWQKLFPLLKSKETIYIEGNHDHAHNSGSEVALFATKHCSSYLLQSGKFHLHIEHGHLQSHKKHETASWVVTSFRTLKYNVWFRDPLEKYLVSHEDDRLHRWHMAKTELAIREYATSLPENHFVVTGHTHLPTFEPENHYINTGYINHGIAYYLEVEDGVLRYVKEQYSPKRTVIYEKTLR